MPELPATTAPPDVQVRVRWVAAVHEGWKGACYGHRDGVSVEGDGHGVTLEALPNTDPTLLRLLTYGAGLSMVLVARGLPVLHATTVRLGDRDIAVVGASGVGKSSFSAALLQRGGRLVADDLTVLGTVRRGFPRLKLWADTAEHFGFDPRQHPRVHPDFAKHSVAVPMVQHERPLTDVLLLERGAGPVRRLLGHEAVALLLANHRLPEVVQDHAGWLLAITELVQTARIWRVPLPGDLAALCRVVDGWVSST